MKFLIFLVLCIFGATICASTPINGPETAIVNGINVANNPGFHVHIHVRVVGQDIQVGSGVYIGTTWVLTVAQMLKPNMDLIRCGFGSIDRNQLVWVQGINYVRHLNYVPATLANNIGLIQLANNPTSTQVNPIPMAIPETQQGADSQGLLFGFGFTTNEGTFATILQQAAKTITTDAICVATFAHLNNRLATDFCAVGAGVNVPSACHGDQGGPFSIGGILVGLHSSNRVSNCFSGQPSAFVRVSAYRGWINSVTNL